MSLEPPPGWSVREAPIEVRGLQPPPPPPPPPAQPSQPPPADRTNTELEVDRGAGGSGGGGGVGRGDEIAVLRPVLAVAGDKAQGGAGGADASHGSPAASASPAPVALLRSFFAPAGEEAPGAGTGSAPEVRAPRSGLAWTSTTAQHSTAQAGRVRGSK